MQEFFKKIWIENPKIRRAIGVMLVMTGLISVITPFTPVGFLLLLGLEILGLRVLVGDKLRDWFRKRFSK